MLQWYFNVRTPLLRPCPQAILLICGILSPPLRAAGPLWWNEVHGFSGSFALKADRHRVGDFTA